MASSSLLCATLARQRQTQLLYPRRRAGRACSPADDVRVVSLEQSLPLFRGGQLEKPLGGYVGPR